MQIIEFINIITGLVIIGCGYAVKSNPDLIAGYNTMSEAEKKKVDVEGLSTAMKKNLIVQGVIIIALSILFKLFRVNVMFPIFLITVVVLIGCGVLIVTSRKYYNKKHDNPSIEPPTVADYNKMLDELKEK